MKKILAIFLSLMLALSMTACGSKEESESKPSTEAQSEDYSGKYICYSARIEGKECGPGTEYVELKKDGNILIYRENTEYHGTYEITGENITAKVDETTINGTISDNVIALNATADVLLSCAKEGTVPPKLTVENFPDDSLVNPGDLDWGQQEFSFDPNFDSAFEAEEQLWWMNGDLSGGGTCIEFKTYNSFLTYADETWNSDLPDYVIDNMHIVDSETKGEIYDFVFVDLLTCYDLVNGSWYKRGDMNTLVNSLTSCDWVSEYEENGQTYRNCFTFSSDGTFNVNFGDEYLFSGTWVLENANEIDAVDEEGSTYDIYLYYQPGTFKVGGFSEFSMIYEPTK